MWTDNRIHIYTLIYWSGYCVIHIALDSCPWESLCACRLGRTSVSCGSSYSGSTFWCWRGSVLHHPWHSPCSDRMKMKETGLILRKKDLIQYFCTNSSTNWQVNENVSHGTTYSCPPAATLFITGLIYSMHAAPPALTCCHPPLTLFDPSQISLYTLTSLNYMDISLFKLIGV